MTIMGKKFKEVSKEKFNEAIKKYEEEKGCKLEKNMFMDWLDFYDFNLSSGRYKKGTWEYTGECLIFRIDPFDKRYIREDIL